MKLVSIIIPVYNTGKVAVKLVEKILKNPYENIEIVVVDDGSTDDSLDLLSKLKSSKVKIYSKKNGGPSAARNFGIDKAKGEYLLFVDSDDIVADDFVSELAGAMRDGGVAMAMTGVRFRKGDEKKDEYLNDFLRRIDESTQTYMLRSLLSDGRMYPAFNKIFRADVVKKNKIYFDEKIKFGEDTKFVLDYLAKAKGEIRLIAKPLYIYNVGTITSTAKKSEGDWRNWQKNYANLKKWVGKTDLRQKYLLSMVYIRWRYTWLKAKLFR